MDIRSWSCSRKDVIRLGQPVYQDDVVSGFAGCCGSSKRSWWRVAWKRLVSTRMFERRLRQHRGYYDAYTYAQNFDEGRHCDDDEPDTLSRSFSMRFADPSKLRFLKQQVGLLDL